MSGCIPAPVGKVFNEVLLKISQVFFTEPRILKKTKMSVKLIKHLHYNKIKKEKTCKSHLTSAFWFSRCGASFLSNCRIDKTWNITDMASGVSRWAPSVLFHGVSLVLASTHTSSRRGTRVAANF